MFFWLIIGWTLLISTKKRPRMQKATTLAIPRAGFSTTKSFQE